MYQKIYPWDTWQAEALQNHLPMELSGLGRDVMREASQHLWSTQLEHLCSPPVLNRLLFDCPELSHNLYNMILETKGLCVAYHETTGELIQLESL